MKVEKALTLWQPWASLICPGPGREPIKTIETRSWSTKHRGPVLICSAAKLPTDSLRVGEWWVNAPRRQGRYQARSYMIENHDGPWRGSEAELVPLPPGAALGVATIVDCLPIVNDGTRRNGIDAGRNGTAAARVDDPQTGVEVIRAVTDQLPYGDFTPGRYGWLLGDIRSFAEPIPVKGGQQLWNVNNGRNPGLAEAITAQMEPIS